MSKLSEGNYLNQDSILLRQITSVTVYWSTFLLVTDSLTCENRTSSIRYWILSVYHHWFSYSLTSIYGTNYNLDLLRTEITIEPTFPHKVLDKPPNTSNYVPVVIIALNIAENDLIKQKTTLPLSVHFLFLYLTQCFLIHMFL